MTVRSVAVVFVAALLGASSAQAVCDGDCDNNGTVSINELVRAVGIALGNNDPKSCSRADFNGDDTVAINELITAVRSALDGCPAELRIVEPPSGTVTPNDAINILAQVPSEALFLEVQAPSESRRLDLAEIEGDPLSFSVALGANSINDIFLTPIFANDERGRVSKLSITQDGDGPKVFIDFPQDEAELTTETTDVAGRVSDLLSGFDGLTVSVNGTPAIVDRGIGTNGTFFLPNVSLETGMPTEVTATATDSVGNETSASIEITRVEIPADAPRMVVVSGNAQEAQVETELPQPVVVQVLRADGSPFANKIVTFKVTRSDGRLSMEPGQEGSMMLQVRTDESGEAAASWTLGTNAGCGNNRIEATSTDIVGTTFFCASGNPAPAAQINIGSGNDQLVEVGAVTPDPLRAWVSDSCNGVAGIPVVFDVVSGDGRVNGQQRTTVTTGPTGHAEAEFTTGPDAGNHRITASFEGNPSGPAEFVVRAVKREQSQPTAFQGVVLDNANQPIGGAECTITINGAALPPLTTNDSGFFEFTSIPAGPGHIAINGLVATKLGGEDIPPGSFPSLAFDIALVPETTNTLPGPILLPRLDPANAREYSTTDDTVLTIEGMEGLVMTVIAGSMTIDGEPAPDGTILSLNQVHHDDIPMPMPDGAAPPFAWTLQPPNAHFDPPIKIEYPNMTALPAGAISYFLSFNHATNEFEIIATGTVSEDGSTITTDQGSGLEISGWGCNCPPYAVTGSCESCDPCSECSDGTLGLPNGGPCDGGDSCRIYQCQDGVCVEVASKLDGAECEDDENQCTADVCREGVCTHEPMPAAPCDDGNPCTANDICNGNVCANGIPLADGSPCQSERNSCELAVCLTGSCTPVASLVDGTQCEDDDDPCTSDICQMGTCAHPIAPGTPCEGDDDCTEDACNSAGVCEPITVLMDGLPCSPDSEGCTLDICQSGSCSHPLAPAGSPCESDGNECFEDACSEFGDCVPTAPAPDGTECTDDGNACRSDLCMGGTCQHPPRAAGSPCELDTDNCTVDACNGTGTCLQVDIAPDGTPCLEDGRSCTDDVCSQGGCNHSHRPNGTACDLDRDECTDDFCMSGDCIAGDTLPSCNDTDGDGVEDAVDNCPYFANADQANLDGDGMGDACDNDDDGDGIEDGIDNCPDNANESQENSDGDALGDACDNCLNTSNDSQSDIDDDSVGDLCDNCPEQHNPDQVDSDGDGLGDDCSICQFTLTTDRGPSPTPCTAAIQEIWSEQFGQTNNPSFNAIPGRAGTLEQEERLLAIGGDRAKVARVGLKLAVTPPEADANLIVAIIDPVSRLVAASTTVTQSQVDFRGIAIAHLSVSSPSPQRHRVIVVHDIGRDGRISASDPTIYTSPYELRLVGKAEYQSAANRISVALPFALRIYPVAGAFLQSFFDDSVASVPGLGCESRASGSTAKLNIADPRLNSATGFRPSGASARIRVNSFSSQSCVARKILASSAVKSAVRSALARQSATGILISGGSRCEEKGRLRFCAFDLKYTDFQKKRSDLIRSGEIGFEEQVDPDLFYAFDHVKFTNGSILVAVDPTSLQVVAVNVSADLEDLYDWDIALEDCHPSLKYCFVKDSDLGELQAGYNTLGKHGRIHRSVVRIDGTLPGFDYCLSECKLGG